MKTDPYLGKTIDGRYQIESRLGEGGMGVVYAARHKVIGKKVAIKVLRGEMAREAEITGRFLQEARAASSIGNPHIIDISDFGTLPDGSTYFVMEYLGGKSLTALMEETKPVRAPRLLHIAKQIASGLGAAHDAGIVQRDLKPDNLMLITRGSGESGKDFVKILDFGIAKVGADGPRLTRAGSVFGTPHYMSPEQAAGTSVDGRTDIYALGIILYEMASGKVPFDADNFMGILTQHMYKTPVPILALVPAPEISPSLDAIIQKCLSKKVEGRYATMGELLVDLEKLERGEVPGALGEMMARSGGFNVPADYFRVSAMPAPVPGMPAGVPQRGRLSLFITMGIVATVGIAALAVTLARPSSGKAEGLVVSTPPAMQVPPASSSSAAPATSVPWAPTVQHVAVVVNARRGQGGPRRRHRPERRDGEGAGRDRRRGRRARRAQRDRARLQARSLHGRRRRVDTHRPPRSGPPLRPPSPSPRSRRRPGSRATRSSTRRATPSSTNESRGRRHGLTTAAPRWSLGPTDDPRRR